MVAVRAMKLLALYFCALFYLAALVAAVSRPADYSHESVGGGALPGKRLVR